VQFAVPPHFTDSGVHHLVLQFQPDHDLTILDYDTVRSMQLAVGEAIRRDGKLTRDASPDWITRLVDRYDPDGDGSLHFEYVSLEDLSRQMKAHAERN
jgi:hypothetical protein